MAGLLDRAAAILTTLQLEGTGTLMGDLTAAAASIGVEPAETVIDTLARLEAALTGTGAESAAPAAPDAMDAEPAAFDEAEATKAAKKFKVVELRAALETAGADTKGLKAALVERLVGVQRAAAAPAPAPSALPPITQTAAGASGAVVVFRVRGAASLAEDADAGTIELPAAAPMSDLRERVGAMLRLAARAPSVDLHLAEMGLGAGGGSGENASLDAWGLVEAGAARTTWTLWANARASSSDAGLEDPWRKGPAWTVDSRDVRTPRGYATLLAHLRVAVTRRDKESFDRFAQNLAELTGNAPAVLAATMLHKRKTVTAAQTSILAHALYGLARRVLPAQNSDLFESADEVVALVYARDPKVKQDWSVEVHDGSCALSPNQPLADPVEAVVDDEKVVASRAAAATRLSLSAGDAAALPRASALHRRVAFAPQPGDAGYTLVLRGFNVDALDRSAAREALDWLESVLRDDDTAFRRKKRAERLQTLPTLSLKQAASDVPRVCIDEDGLPAVFTGTESCGSGLVMFRPLKGQTTFDPHELAKKLGDATTSAVFTAPVRRPKELIVHCVDTSNSMGENRFSAAAGAEANSSIDLTIERPAPRQVDVLEDLIRFRRMHPDAFDVFRTKYLAGGTAERRALEVLVRRIPALEGHVDSMRQLLREAISLERTEDATLARLLPEDVLTAEAGAQIDIFVRRSGGSTVTIAVRERFRIAAVVDALCARDDDWARWDATRLSHGAVSSLDTDTRLDVAHIAGGHTVFERRAWFHQLRPTSAQDETELTLTVKNADTGAVQGTLRVKWGDKPANVAYKLWAALGDEYSPAQKSLWLNIRDSGDGYSQGMTFYGGEGPTHPDECKEQIGPALDRYEGATKRTLFTCGRLPSVAEESRTQTRMQVAQQLFGVLVDRSQGHDLQNEMGLVTFDSDVTVACALTPLYEKFREKVNETYPDGDTACYDALLKSIGLLVARREELGAGPQPRIRIVCFTDGEDTESEATASDVAKALVEAGCVLDVICVAEKKPRELLGLAKISSGYAIAPDSIESGTIAMSMELMLASEHRAPVPVAAPPGGGAPTRFAVAKQREWDHVDAATVPQIRAHASATKRALSLDAALSPPAKRARTTASSRTKRLMRELAALKATPHPACDLYPTEGDLGYWKVVIEGPDGLYKGATLLLSIEFPDDYPNVAPVLRFISEIRHVNVNSHGRVCHAILEGDYGVDVSVKDILSFVYGLLMCPDVETATDTNLASLHFEYPERYQQAVERFTRQATKSRAAWASELLGED